MDMVPQYDQEGNAILDKDGKPVMGTSTGNGGPNPYAGDPAPVYYDMFGREHSTLMRVCECGGQELH